jgi:PAS domain S-box-containing protein
MMPTLCQLFFAAVAVSTWYGGMQPGLLATALSTLAMGYFFTQPVYLLGNFALDNILQLGTFVPVAILISSLNSGLRSAKQGFDRIDVSHEIDKHGNSQYLVNNNNLVGIVENGVLVRGWGTQQDMTERQQVEVARRESEKRFRRLVESNIFGVALGDFSGGVHYANDYFLNMVGYTREELHSGKLRWDAITAPEYIHLDAQRTEELSKQGVGTPFEKEYIHKDGSRVPILIGGALLQEPYDTQQEMIVFSLDLSERKRIEEALRQREEQLRLITDAVPVLISYVDAQQRYRFNNKRYEEWHRIPASEIYGKHIKEVVGESVYESIRPYVEAVLRGRASLL